MADDPQDQEVGFVCRQYDPEMVAVVGSYKNQFALPVRTYKQDGDEIIVVWLTAQGNEALCEVCHTSDQKDVWRFPSFEFAVCKDSLSISQVSAGSGGITIGLTIDRSVLRGSCDNNTHSVFVEDVRLPGYWGGACAGCKWRDHGACCMFLNHDEAKYQPSGLASLPWSVIEELED